VCGWWWGKGDSFNVRRLSSPSFSFLSNGFLKRLAQSPLVFADDATLTQ
jgi:hypothetical protein